MDKKINVSLALGLLSLAGIIALWIVHFLDSKPVSEPGFALAGSKGHNIAYIHTDSILANYDLVKASADELAEKTRRLDADLSRRQQELESEVAYFQESMRKKSLSESSAQEIYQKLMEKQQGIMELKDQYYRELAEDEGKINQMLVDTVTNFLKRYNMTLGFDYILGYNKTGNIFYTNDTFDITPQVVKELNAAYQANLKSQPSKKPAK